LFCFTHFFLPASKAETLWNLSRHVSQTSRAPAFHYWDQSRGGFAHTTAMPQTAQEEVEITALIRGILNGYPGNSAILREYLQNSDDAKATKQASVLSLVSAVIY
jgi:hypothetical protein